MSKKISGPHGIDITKPGGIEALMAFHRQTFGDAVMEADGDGGSVPSGDSGNLTISGEAILKDGGEQLGDAGQKALKAERDARKTAERSAADLQARLKEFEDAKLSDLERAQGQAAEAAAELEALRAENVRKTVALAKGLPVELIEFLPNGTEEEVAAKADLLLSKLNTQSAPKPDFSQGAQGQSTRITTPGANTFAAGVRL